ncbi:alpha/beta hydrolase [Candidatus Beckwithbacteria bacterium]|nr:alpha/beta hydrolase [Candidatus Beckwithbacteria bacterium]
MVEKGPISEKIHILHFDSEIRLNIQEVLPSVEIGNSEKSVVFFPGWGIEIDEELPSSYKELLQNIADKFGCPVVIAKTTSERRSDGYHLKHHLEDEAQVAAEYLEKQGIKNPIVIGYSKGGGYAAEFAIALQRLHNQPEALILLAPIGISEQHPIKLAFNFGLDTLVETIPDLIRERHKRINPKGEKDWHGKVLQSLCAAWDIAKGLSKQIERDGFGYPEHLRQEVIAMSKLNSKLAEIQSQVIVILGAKDRPLGLKGTKADVLSLFPESSKVTVLIAERAGHHAFALLRSSQIVSIVQGLINREEKGKQ